MGRFQVTCINKKGNHFNPHERISYIGNSANNWKLSENNAIGRINRGADTFYTLVNGREAEVIVAAHNGRAYVKTTADGYCPDNLLSLSECGSNCVVKD